MIKGIKTKVIEGNKKESTYKLLYNLKVDSFFYLTFNLYYNSYIKLY